MKKYKSLEDLEGCDEAKLQELKSKYEILATARENNFSVLKTLSPFLTVLLSILTLYVGTCNIIEEQTNQRELEQRKTIRLYKDRFLKIIDSQDVKSNYELGFLMGDLGVLLNDFPLEKRHFTSRLKKISSRFDFRIPAHAAFHIIFFQSWDGYKPSLRQSSRKEKIYRYLLAFKALKKQFPEIFNDKYRARKFDTRITMDSYPEETVNWLEDLLMGFKFIIDSPVVTPKEKKVYLDKILETTGSPDFVKYYIPPAPRPE